MNEVPTDSYESHGLNVALHPRDQLWRTSTLCRFGRGNEDRSSDLKSLVSRAVLV